MSEFKKNLDMVVEILGAKLPSHFEVKIDKGMILVESAYKSGLWQSSEIADVVHEILKERFFKSIHQTNVKNEFIYACYGAKDFKVMLFANNETFGRMCRVVVVPV